MFLTLGLQRNGDRYVPGGGVRGDGEGRDLQETRDIHRPDTDRVSLALEFRLICVLTPSAAFDFVLLGVMWTQLWSYVMSSRRDKRLNRVIVVSLVLESRRQSESSWAGYQHICCYSDVSLASPAVSR